MRTNRGCPNRAQCIIDLLARRKAESMGAAWTLLLSAGQDLCSEREEDKARQSFEQAVKLAEDLAAVNDKDANRIKASALTCLGALSLCKKQTENATVYLHQGQDIFAQDGDMYGQAVVLFALAQAYDMRGDWRKVFRYYEWSQRVLSHVGSDSATIYLRQLVEEEHAKAIKKWEKMSQERWVIDEILKDVSLGVLPIFSRIPAGNPRPIPQLVSGYVEADRFIIDDKPYRVAGGERHKIRLDFSLQVAYIAFHVEGDSMDKAGIDDGDYVVLRASSVTGSDLEPNSGDIVAVALPETDAVTLKRFRRKSGQVVFEPDSTNPTHVSYPFETSSEYGISFKIVGIHTATLKPL